MGVMKFVLSDELEEMLRSGFRKKGDLSNIAELALRKHLDMHTSEQITEELDNIES